VRYFEQHKLGTSLKRSYSEFHRFSALRTGQFPIKDTEYSESELFGNGSDHFLQLLEPANIRSLSITVRFGIFKSFQ
jgi:hypothetical protein